MLFEQIRTGGDRTFSYVVADEGSRAAALVDPGYDPERLLDRIRELELELAYVINTHSHYDHTGGNAHVLGHTGAKLAAFESGDIPLVDGSTLELGELTLRIIWTPGHTYDGICILVEDVLITGDTLFVGKVGGTGFGDDARAEYDSLHQKILTLPEHIRVFPGHDYGVRPESTIGDEKKENPFLLRDSLEAFVDLKRNWTAYKQKHGIT